MMISQRHDDTIQSEERIPSPVENKQMATPLEKQSELTAASPRRWIPVLLSILVVALSLVAGSMVAWPWEGSYGFLSSYESFFLVVGAMCLTAFVGTFLVRVFLFRSWRALWVVPVAWIVGDILTVVLFPLIVGGWPALQNELPEWSTGGMVILYALVPLLLCSFVGAVCGIGFSAWWKKRQQLQ
jgi:hypothetical protein